MMLLNSCYIQIITLIISKDLVKKCLGKWSASLIIKRNAKGNNDKTQLTQKSK